MRPRPPFCPSCVSAPFLLLALLVATPALAQLTTGTIQGVVKDESAGALPGATVTIKNLDAGVTRTSRRDSRAGRPAPSPWS